MRGEAFIFNLLNDIASDDVTEAFLLRPECIVAIQLVRNLQTGHPDPKANMANYSVCRLDTPVVCLEVLLDGEMREMTVVAPIPVL